MMNKSEYDLPTLLTEAGFQRRSGASSAAIARLEAAFNAQLPADFAQLWAYSDGMSGNGIDILSLAKVEEYAGTFEGGFDYVPFTECHDSNPYAVCCRDPIRGM